MDKLFSLHMDKISTLKVLSDKQIGQVMRLLIEYQETGTNSDVPDTASVAFAFEILKQSLDALNQKRSEFSEHQRDRVNKRWKKEDEVPGNTTEYHGIPGNNPVSSGNTEIYRTIPDDTNKEKEKETDKEKAVVVDHLAKKDRGQSEADQPPPRFENIKNECKALGFYIDSAKVKQILNSNLDPGWLSGPHSVFKFASERVREKYPDKDADALKPIFISAVTKWEDIRDAYPMWRNEQVKKDQAAAMEKAKHRKPKTCECGAAMIDGYLTCKKCGGRFDFNEKTASYEFHPKKVESENLAKDYQEFMRRKSDGRDTN